MVSHVTWMLTTISIMEAQGLICAFHWNPDAWGLIPVMLSFCIACIRGEKPAPAGAQATFSYAFSMFDEPHLFRDRADPTGTASTNSGSSSGLRTLDGQTLLRLQATLAPSVWTDYAILPTMKKFQNSSQGSTFVAFVLQHCELQQCGVAYTGQF